MELDPDIQTLVSLGLTFRQANTYSTLLDAGDASVKTIAKISKVSRPNLYQTVRALQKLNLIEEVIATPLIFRAVPLNIALQSLLKNKNEEYSNLKKKSKELLERRKCHAKTNNLIEEKQEFVIIPPGEGFKRRVYQAFGRSQSSIKAIAPLAMFDAWNALDFQVLKKANQRGVKFQLLIPEKSYDKNLLTPLKTRKTTFVELRLAPALMPVRFCIFDDKELFYGTKDDNLFKAPELLTTCQSLISVVKEYFDVNWRNATPIDIKTQ